MKQIQLTKTKTARQISDDYFIYSYSNSRAWTKNDFVKIDNAEAVIIEGLPKQYDVFGFYMDKETKENYNLSDGATGYLFGYGDDKEDAIKELEKRVKAKHPGKTLEQLILGGIKKVMKKHSLSPRYEMEER